MEGPEPVLHSFGVGCDNDTLVGDTYSGWCQNGKLVTILIADSNPTSDQNALIPRVATTDPPQNAVMRIMEESARHEDAGEIFLVALSHNGKAINSEPEVSEL
jgi:hypothetical protein